MRKNTPLPYGEPLPYYMTAMGMQGARFIVDNPTSGTPSGEAPNGGEPKPTNGPTPNGGEEGNEKLGEPGKKALEAERERAKELERQLKEANEKNKAFEDAKLSDQERAEKKAREDAEELERLRNENLRLSALATHGIPAEYQALVKGKTAEELEEAAKLVSQLVASKTQNGNEDPNARKLEPVPLSKSGGDGPSASTFQAGQDLYQQRHPKKQS